MRTLITIREPGRDPVPLVIEGAHFKDPNDEPIDREIATDDLYALPGLADCHTHVGMENIGQAGSLTDDDIRSNSIANAWLQVESGVLLIADKGSPSDVSLEILDAPPHTRPVMQMAGRMIAPPDGYYADYRGEVDEHGLAEAVRAATKGPASWVKIIGDWPRKGLGPRANYSEAALRKAISIAHAAGRRVAVHTMAPAGIRPAVDAGVDSIEHGLFLSADDLSVLADRNGAWVPTVLGAESIIGFLGADSTGGKLLAAGIRNVQELLPEAERLGATVLAGTDLAVPHGKVALEAIRLHELGLSMPAALHAATRAAYDYLGVAREFSPGSIADVVFVRDDPREHLETLLSPAMIIRSGQFLTA